VSVLAAITVHKFSWYFSTIRNEDEINRRKTISLKSEKGLCSFQSEMENNMQTGTLFMTIKQTPVNDNLLLS
jgi:hypothetical protein